MSDEPVITHSSKLCDECRGTIVNVAQAYAECTLELSQLKRRVQTMTDIDAMWQDLETRDERVDICRSYPDEDGRRHWIVRLHGIGHHGDTIAEAIAAAHATPPPLPRVPRPPKAHVWRGPFKFGARWGVSAEGSASVYEARTKRDATVGLERIRANEAERHDEWTRTWAPVVHGGTHGVDWLWEDDPR